MSGGLIEGGIEEQTEQCFENIRSVLKAAGLNLEHVVKTTVFLTDINDFKAMNGVYASQFEKPCPARTTIGVASLPLGARIEIEVVAKK